MTGRFLLANPAYCEITGYSEQELASRTFQSITHPDDLRSNWSLARRMFSGEVRSIIYEKRYIRKDSRTVWVRNSVSMVHDSAGNAVRSIAVSEEIPSEPRENEPPVSTARRFRLISKTLHHPEEEERRRIARDLHDSTGQLLAGLIMTLTRLKSSHFESAQTDVLLTEALELAGQCSREVRALSYLLHPPLLEQFGLAGALRTCAEGFRRRTGIQLDLDLPFDLGRLSREIEVAVFRIVQEGLTNIHRHAQSSLAAVSLERQPRQIVLEMQDWGRGFSNRSAGVGLASMRERAHQLGGRVKISSGSEGTRIVVFLPLPKSNVEQPYSDC